ncbi:MAG: hypothetical protein D6814_00360 [Calditrichaeota bacterium]|nr:MAG: hypothetical protein D6814_00360 [Calditrichota bacterium]
MSSTTADQVAPEVLMNAVLGKINDVLLNGDGKVIPKSPDHYFAFLSPGIPLLNGSFDYAIEGFGGVYRRNDDVTKLHQSVGPNESGETDNSTGEGGAAEIAADVLRKYQSAEAFAAICDLVPDTNGIIDSNLINLWQPETRVSHAYTIALQFSQVYDVQIDEETKKKINRWRSLLQSTKKERDIVNENEVREVIEESELTKKYREKMLAYYSEAMAYNHLRISALSGKDSSAVHEFAINGPIMQLKVQAAMSDWVSNGFKNDYERINAAISSVEGRSMALLKQTFKKDFMRSLLTNPSSGANFSYTAPTPADFAQSQTGWQRFWFNSGSLKSNYKFLSKASSGGGALSLGFFTIGGSGGVKSHKIEGKIHSKKFNLTFEMARVPIYRPGISLTFLLSKWWRFDPGNQMYKATLLSDGERPPKGLMPAISTDCIFVRNLELTFGESESTFQNYLQQVGGSGGLRFGPFFLGGKHKNIKSESDYQVDWTGQGVKIKGLQLIGFLCYLLPKCPNPNPEIDKWI